MSVVRDRSLPSMIATLVAAVLVATLALTAGASSAGAEEPTVAGQGRVNPPALWLQLNETPTEEQLQFAAKHYRVAVFNAWQVPALRRLKELNPAITVLVYKCLSSARSYSGAFDDGVDADVLPTGVGYAEASARPEWFATDTSGRRIEWRGWGAHWQMATWDASYRQRWTENVTREVVEQGWDGVMADNALPSLEYYTGAGLAGGRTDADLRASVQALVDGAGAELNAHGKILVPNIGDGRLHDGRWEALSAHGGGFEEQFMHWGTDPGSGYVPDWEWAGWTTVAAEMGSSGLNLARTSAGPDDTRPYRYGLASFWIGGGGKGAFTAVSPDQYEGTPLRTEQTWELGSPLTTPMKVGTAWTRSFSAGFAAANPSSTTSQVVTVPARMQDADGRWGGQITLAPLTGVIFRSAAVSPEPVSAPAPVAAPGTSDVAVVPTPTQGTPVPAPGTPDVVVEQAPTQGSTGPSVGLAGATCTRRADGVVDCVTF